MELRNLPRVFIVDRSLVVMERLATSINDVADVIGSAANARDAIKGIRSGNPQLAVLDIAIPNGIELLKQIKSLRPPVIVAILTHSAEEASRRFCQRLGAEYFLDKIYDFHKVRGIVIALGGL